MTANKPARLTAERIAEIRVAHEPCDCQEYSCGDFTVTLLLAHVAALEADCRKMARALVHHNNDWGFTVCELCEADESEGDLVHDPKCLVLEHTDSGKEGYAV